jgi:tRNA pseudouridine32 synthase/23S rRNA pseudouridine746 synthase
MDLKIVFENEHLILVNKPAGVLTVPSRIGADDERLCLGTFLQDQKKIQIYPVHRLDVEVCGLVLFAKTSTAHKIANLWFEHKLIHKTYAAYTEGQTDCRIGETYEWKCKLLRGKKRAYESPVGKDSLTLATYLGKKEKGLLWDLSPVTGRSHQLRYELYRHGNPILGDKLYNSTQPWSDGIALCSYALHLEKIPEQNRLGLPISLQISSFSDNIK